MFLLSQVPPVNEQQIQTSSKITGHCSLIQASNVLWKTQVVGWVPYSSPNSLSFALQRLESSGALRSCARPSSFVSMLLKWTFFHGNTWNTSPQQGQYNAILQLKDHHTACKLCCWPLLSLLPLEWILLWWFPPSLGPRRNRYLKQNYNSD